MRLKSAAATLLVCASLVLVPAVQAAQARPLQAFHGVRVMPGGVVVDGRILYEGGGVVVVPSPGRSFDSCPAGFACLFANTGWGGTMVAFSTCCAWNNLSAYGFDDTASSWRNRLSVDAQIAMSAGGVRDQALPGQQRLREHDAGGLGQRGLVHPRSRLGRLLLAAAVA